MKVKLTKREQQSLGVLVLTAVIVGWAYSVLLGYLAREGARLQEGVRQQRAELETLARVVGQKDAVQKREIELREAIAGYRIGLPSEEELPNVRQFLSEAASQANVTIQAVITQKPADEAKEPIRVKETEKKKEGPPSYKQIPIQIDATAGFHQLGLFLSKVETSPYPLQVVSLRISENPKDPKRHLVKLVIQTYVIPGADEPAG